MQQELVPHPGQWGAHESLNVDAATARRLHRPGGALTVRQSADDFNGRPGLVEAPVHLSRTRSGLLSCGQFTQLHYAGDAEQCQGIAEGPHLQVAVERTVREEVLEEVDVPASDAGAAIGQTSPGGAHLPEGTRIRGARTLAQWQCDHPERSGEVRERRPTLIVR